MTKELLLWYDNNNFLMPWRINKNPYRIWISEIMLQQTQVKTVIPYYEKWMVRYPTVEILADSNLDDILKSWEGLGYYKRAHNIKKSSEIIQYNLGGSFPKHGELKKLPGIGDYTYSAIMSIAFDEKVPAIDGNVKRVSSRIFEEKFSTPSEIKTLSNELKKYMPNNRPGCFNQAIMDLGREICKPQNPECCKCPIHNNCKALINESVNQYPVKEERKKPPILDVVVGFIFNDDMEFLITKRPQNKMLGGLWELPGGKKEEKETFKTCLKREIKEELNINIEVQKKIGTVKHSYSHFKIRLHGFMCKAKSGKLKIQAADDYSWIKLNDIENFSFPKATHKIFEKINDKII